MTTEPRSHLVFSLSMTHPEFVRTGRLSPAARAEVLASVAAMTDAEVAAALAAPIAC